MSLHSLNAAEMNGVEGVLMSWDGDRERWSVHVASLDKTIALKPENLRGIDTSSTAITSAGPCTVAIGSGHLGVTLTNHQLGVRIERAHPPDSIAQAGLRCGDVITAVDSVKVTDHAMACALLGSDVTKPIILHEGPQPTHTVEYYPAAAVANLLYERSIVGRLANAWGRVTAPPPPTTHLKDGDRKEADVASEEQQPTASEGRPPATTVDASRNAGLPLWLLLGGALIVLWQLLSNHWDAVLDQIGL